MLPTYVHIFLGIIIGVLVTVHIVFRIIEHEPIIKIKNIMKAFKLLIGLIGSIFGLFPIVLFIPLFYKGNVQWLMMIRKLPEWALYLFGISIVLSCIFMLINSIRFLTKSNKIDKDQYNKNMKFLFNQEIEDIDELSNNYKKSN